MSELFPIEEQLSPYLEFVRRHGIEVVQSNDDFAAFQPDCLIDFWSDRYSDGETDGDCPSCHDIAIQHWRELKTTGIMFVASSEREAIRELAYVDNLKGWQEVNW